MNVRAALGISGGSVINVRYSPLKLGINYDEAPSDRQSFYTLARVVIGRIVSNSNTVWKM
jgi:hypothetical protein